MSTPSLARGVSPYLPLNLAPDIERQIEQVLILGDHPVIRRPIAAATVLDALPKACAIDAALCQRVKSYLQKYVKGLGITQLEGSVALTSGTSEQVAPNSHGMKVDSPWSASASAYYQFGDYTLFNLGGVAYDGRAKPTGTFVSVGFSYAQLDVGYRDHWFSPLGDSSTLISTEAPTMPSITLSNYDLITPLGFSYEIFLAQMSWQDGIRYRDTTTSGYPSLSGLHVAMEPVSGYSLSLNRIYQYGGGARGTGASGFFDSLFSSSNNNDTTNTLEFGNQVASITSSIVFPGAVPFAVRLEYAGDDNAYDRLRLGVTNMTVGLDFPKLWKRYDLTFEISEWQQLWYQHHIYPDGLRNDGIVIGHWFGESKVFTDQVFGNSQSVALGVQLSSGYLRARYRTLANADYSPIPYDRSQDLSLSYTTKLQSHRVGAEINVGHDVFGESYSRLSLNVDLVANHDSISSIEPEPSDSESVTEYFVDTGVNFTSAFERIAFTLHPEWTSTPAGYHFGIGARRKVSARNDLGVRLEFDDVVSRSLISLRALDYRFRFNRSVAMSGFFGFSRYEIFSLPAYGYYAGVGGQWTNFIRNWDLGIDYRFNDKLTRTKVLPTDPLQPVGGGIYVDTRGTAMYLSYHF
jgi:hypothetical protein